MNDPSDPRVRELIAALDLAPHPEGGFFREVHRSPAIVEHPAIDGRPPRAASTMIDFLLVEGNPSDWHRVRSEEIWLHLEGAPLILDVLDAPLETHSVHTLGPTRIVGGGAVVRPHHVVPADAWQAARTTGAFSLVACIVAPGFDFADFSMLRDDADAAAHVRTRFPALADQI